MSPNARLFALDINSKFIEHVRERIQDPRLMPVVGSAEDLGEILRAHGAPRADAIVSSLGLANMSDRLRTSIIQEAARQLGPMGVFSQYQYVHITGELKPNWSRY